MLYHISRNKFFNYIPKEVHTLQPIQNNIAKQKYNIHKTHQMLSIKKYSIVYVSLIFFLSLKYRLDIRSF